MHHVAHSTSTRPITALPPRMGIFVHSASITCTFRIRGRECTVLCTHD